MYTLIGSLFSADEITVSSFLRSELYNNMVRSVLYYYLVRVILAKYAHKISKDNGLDKLYRYCLQSRVDIGGGDQFRFHFITSGDRLSKTLFLLDKVGADSRYHNDKIANIMRSIIQRGKSTINDKTLYVLTGRLLQSSTGDKHFCILLKYIFNHFDESSWDHIVLLHDAWKTSNKLLSHSEYSARLGAICNTVESIISMLLLKSAICAENKIWLLEDLFTSIEYASIQQKSALILRLLRITHWEYSQESCQEVQQILLQQAKSLQIPAVQVRSAFTNIFNKLHGQGDRSKDSFYVYLVQLLYDMSFLDKKNALSVLLFGKTGDLRINEFYAKSITPAYAANSMLLVDFIAELQHKQSANDFCRLFRLPKQADSPVSMLLALPGCLKNIIASFARRDTMFDNGQYYYSLHSPHGLLIAKDRITLAEDGAPHHASLLT
jgi:hypothetical protein